MSDFGDLDYIEEFASSFVGNLSMMADSESTVGEPVVYKEPIMSSGIAVIVGITGKRPGRVIMDTDMATAKKLTEIMNEGEEIDETLILDTMAEFCNIVSGHTTTKINNKNKGLGLMLTPPGIFMGTNLKIISPRIESKIIKADSSLGQFTVSVGFERGI